MKKIWVVKYVRLGLYIIKTKLLRLCLQLIAVLILQLVYLLHFIDTVPQW